MHSRDTSDLTGEEAQRSGCDFRRRPVVLLQDLHSERANFFSLHRREDQDSPYSKKEGPGKISAVALLISVSRAFEDGGRKLAERLQAAQKI
jgi:hypothetical protein